MSDRFVALITHDDDFFADAGDTWPLLRRFDQPLPTTFSNPHIAAVFSAVGQVRRPRPRITHNENEYERAIRQDMVGNFALAVNTVGVALGQEQMAQRLATAMNDTAMGTNTVDVDRTIEYALRESVQTLTAQVEALTAAEADLRGQLSGQSQGGSSTQTSEELRKARNDLLEAQAKIRTLEARIPAPTATQTVDNSRVKELEREVERLSKAARTSDREAKRVIEMNARLRDQNTELQIAQRENDQLHEDLQAADDQIEALSAANPNFGKDEGGTASNNTLRAALTTSEANVERLRNDLNQSEEARRSAFRRVEQLEAERGQQFGSADVEKLRGDLQTCQLRGGELNLARERAESRAGELEREIQTLRAGLPARTNDRADSQLLQQEINNERFAREEAESRVEMLERQLQEARQGSTSDDPSGFSQEIRNMAARAQELVQQQRNAATTRLQNDLETARSRATQLEEQIRANTEAAAQTQRAIEQRAEEQVQTLQRTQQEALGFILLSVQGLAAGIQSQIMPARTIQGARGSQRGSQDNSGEQAQSQPVVEPSQYFRTQQERSGPRDQDEDAISLKRRGPSLSPGTANRIKMSRSLSQMRDTRTPFENPAAIQSDPTLPATQAGPFIRGAGIFNAGAGGVSVAAGGLNTGTTSSNAGAFRFNASSSTPAGSNPFGPQPMSVDARRPRDPSREGTSRTSSDTSYDNNRDATSRYGQGPRDSEETIRASNESRRQIPYRAEYPSIASTIGGATSSGSVLTQQPSETSLRASARGRTTPVGGGLTRATSAGNMLGAAALSPVTEEESRRSTPRASLGLGRIDAQPPPVMGDLRNRTTSPGDTGNIGRGGQGRARGMLSSSRRYVADRLNSVADRFDSIPRGRRPRNPLDIPDSPPRQGGGRGDSRSYQGRAPSPEL